MVQTEIERVRPDGSVVPCLVTAFPLNNACGELIGVMESFRDITERRELLAQVKESEERYRALVELSTEVGEAIVMLQDTPGCEGAQVYVSDQWLKITGYGRDKIIGRSIFDLLSPSERDEIVSRYRRRMSGEIMPGLFEITIVRSDGASLPVEYTAAVSVYQGKPADVIYLRDISERKRIETEKRESEARYQALINLGTEAGEAIIMVSDKDGKEGVHSFISDQWIKITGYSLEELQKMTFRELLHPKDREASLARHRLKMSGVAIPGLYEMTVIRKDGTEVPIELTGGFTTYKGQRCTVNYIRDITQRKQAEEKIKLAQLEIRQSEERYRSLFEDAPVAIWELDYTDVKNRIDSLRGKGITDFENFFKKNPDEFLDCFNLRKVIGFNNAVVALLAAHSKEDVMVNIQKHLETRPSGLQTDLTNLVALTKGETKISYQIFDPDFKGEWHHLSVEFVLAPGFENTWSRIFLSHWDISDRVKAENELIRHQAQLEDKVSERTKQLTSEIENRKKAEEEIHKLYLLETKLRLELENQIKRRTEFTRTLVHELKTPLTPMLGSSDILLRKIKDDELARIARNIHRGALDLNDRVSDLIDLNQGEMGIITLLPRVVNPVKELRDISDYVRPMAERKEQRLVVDLPEILPDTCLDPARLRQIVLNLLENAFRHTPQGGTITLKAVRARDSLMVEISDNGCGIAKKDLGRIFDPYPGKRIGDNLDGLGIGLPLCKMLVELHGGTIKVKSQKDNGSIFTFIIPMKSRSLQPREK